MGDFNSRIGQQSPIYKGDYEGPGVQKRLSKDKESNGYGEKLLDMCGLENLYILNGQWNGDWEGQFTFINNNGASVIDLVLATEGILGRIAEIKIVEWIKTAHSPILAQIKGQPREKREEKKGEKW